MGPFKKYVSCIMAFFIAFACITPQLAFTFSKLPIEKLEQGVKYVQSQQ